VPQHRKYKSNAERQAAYRRRKAASAAAALAARAPAPGPHGPSGSEAIVKRVMAADAAAS
jgi:hypothetical protein